MRMNKVQPDGGCRGKCSRVATAGTTKPGDDDGFVDDYFDDVVDDPDDQLTYYLEVDSTVVDDAVVVDVHDVKNVHTCKKEKRLTSSSSASSPPSSSPA